MPPIRGPFIARFAGRLLLLVPPIVLAAFAGGGSARIHLTPQFLPGHPLRYQIQSREETTGKTTTPITNPEGATHSTQTIHIVVRLNVIGSDPSAPGALRIRVACESASAVSQGDALDLASADVDDRYNRMEGHSLDFVVQLSGQVAAVPSSDTVFADAATAGALLPWLGRISYGGVPRGGIARGEKWKTERQLPDAPLSGLIWRTESSYLREEACRPGTAPPSIGAPAGIAEGECAILLTRFWISRQGSAKSDATPQEYRRNGLRTSGKWSGSGESLDSISLSSGFLTSSTQTSTQDLDYQITSPATGSSVHHQGRTESRSQINLLPN